LFENVHLECNQQLSFTLKMHQNRWRLGLCPRPQCGSLQRSPDPLARLRGLLLRGGEKEGSGWEANRRKGEGKGETLDPHSGFATTM